MNKIVYGYCRISTPTQNIERQERNIKQLHTSLKRFTPELKQKVEKSGTNSTN